MHSQCSLLVSWRFHEMGFLAFDKCHVAHVCMSILGFKSFLYCTVCFSKHLHDILTLYTSGSSSTAMRVLLLLRPFDFIMLHWPRCVFAAPGKHWSRGRIAELVMINLVPDDDAYFKRKFNAEILYEWDGNDDVCDVCCTALNGFRDGTCILCGHTGVCRDCVQIIDPDRLEPHCTEEYLSKRLQRGNRVCLPCGPFTLSGTGMRKKYRMWHICATTWDMLTNRNATFALLQIAFVGWNVWRKARRPRTHIESVLCEFFSCAGQSMVLSLSRSPSWIQQQA